MLMMCSRCFFLHNKYRYLYYCSTNIVYLYRLQRRETPTVQRLRAFFCGRGDRIRTCDPMLPKHVRYQLRYTSILTADIIYVLTDNCK